MLRRTLLTALASLPFAAAARAAGPAADDLENHLILTLKSGKVMIRLRPDVAPRHVERIKVLTRRGFYDGLKFHRVIAGFMAQTGDPKGDGTGGSDLPNLPAEFNPMPFERGTVGMARSSSPNSANSQFFIMFDDGSFLNGNYTAFAQVVSGMEHVDQIKKGPKEMNGVVDQPDVIVKMQVAADAK